MLFMINTRSDYSLITVVPFNFLVVILHKYQIMLIFFHYFLIKDQSSISEPSGQYWGWSNAGLVGIGARTESLYVL